MAPIGAARHPRITTTIVLSQSAWNWLRQKAFDEAQREGGRPSASGVIERLIREEADRSS
jgi:hypothetical protein